jgi:hypothetical protein
MKAVRKLCLRGNALYICIPKAMAATFGWSPENWLTVEAIGPHAARIRPFDASDTEHAQLLSMNIGVPRVVPK